MNVHCGGFFMSISYAECLHCHCHRARAWILKGCCSFLNVSREIWPPLSIEGTCSHTVQRLTQIPESTEWVAETRSLISECGRAVGGGQNMQHFLLFWFFYFLSVFIIFGLLSYLTFSAWLSRRLSVNKASKQTHPGGPKHSWQWGSCCGCRRPPRPRSEHSGPGSSGCWCRQCLRHLSTTAGGWESARPRCSLVPPWKTGRSRSLCRNTGRSWTGSSEIGC